jgi:hypothetical protein
VSKVFFAGDLPSNYCSRECQPSSNKRRGPTYFTESARKRRAKAKKAEKKKAADQLIKAFAQFLKTAANPRASEQVGHIIKRIGPDVREGWKKVDPWLARQKSGDSVLNIWNSLDRTTRTVLEELLRGL